MAKEKRESVHGPYSQFGGSKIADQLGPEPNLVFCDSSEKERREGFRLSKACKAFIGADQDN
jgi:hypothetical protein